MAPQVAENIPGGGVFEDCYKEVEKCIHKHTTECYPAVADEKATGNDAKEPTECKHSCDEESGCITKTLDCQHGHDEECGYVKAVKGSPCTHTCELCAKESEEEAGEATEETTEEATEGTIGEDIRPATDSDAQDTSREDIARVQALIDALPDADTILAMDDIGKQSVSDAIDIIDAAMLKLTEEQKSALNMERYNEAYQALAKGLEISTYALTGAGTEASPYIISTAEDWVAVCATGKFGNLSSKYIELADDIDLTGTTWTSQTLVTGQLDGNGNQITGFSQPLFDGLSNSTVKNLAVTADINDTTNNCIGAIARYTIKTGNVIENCYVSGSVTSKYEGIGGLIGDVQGVITIKNCIVDAEVKNIEDYKKSGAGGLVGRVQTKDLLTVENCYTLGTVTNDVGMAGGFVGTAYYSGILVSITNSAALQSCVSGKYYNGRVVSDATLWFKTDKLANNYAYADMLNSENMTYDSDIGAAKANGEHVSKADCTSAAFWRDTLKFDESVWTIEDGKLPALSSVNASTGEPPLYLAETYTISGSVTAGTSSAIAGAVVTFTSESGTETTATAAAGGTYTAELPAGTYSVRVAKTGYLTTSETGYAVSTDATGKNFTLETNPVALGDDATASIVFATTDADIAIGTDDVTISYTGTDQPAASDFVVSSTENKLADYEGVTVTTATNSAVTVQFAKSLNITNDTAYLFYKDSCVGEITLIKTVKKVVLPAPAAAAWDTTVPGRATWSTVTNAVGYSVQLYKNDAVQGDAVTTTAADYDFTSVIADTAGYTFKVKATGDATYGDSVEAVSGTYEFTEQTLETVATAAAAALSAMETSNATTAEEVLKVVNNLITNKAITAAWSTEKGFNKIDGSVGAVDGTNGTITGTIVLTLSTDSTTREVHVKLTIAPLFTASFSGGDGATGTAPASQESLKAGATITLPANTFRMASKLFRNWSDGSKTYAVGDTYTMPDTNVTFTAQWGNDVWDGTTASASLEGTGKSDDPYLIYNGADLQYLAKRVVASGNYYYKLMADVDMGNHDFAGIPDIRGSFDGNHCTIRGLNGTGGGLFTKAGSYMGDSTTIIRDLTIEDASITSKDDNAGILVKYASGNLRIENCQVTGTITNNGYAGGLVGYVSYLSEYKMQVNIDQCYAGVTFHSTGSSSGGLVGRNNGDNHLGNGKGSIELNISNSYATPVGAKAGIYGSGRTTTITNCYAAGQTITGAGIDGNVGKYGADIRNSVSIFPEIVGKGRIYSPDIPWNDTVAHPDGTNNYGYAGTIMRDSKGNIVTPAADEFAANKAQGADVTTVQLKDQSFYEGLGWDFKNTWKMVSGYDFPVLQSQTDAPGLELDMTSAVTSITLDKASATLAQKGTLQLTAVVDVANGAGRGVVWSSNSPNVVVDQNGKVMIPETAVAGIYTVTATAAADGSKIATCTITVDTTDHAIINTVENKANSPDLATAFYASDEDANNAKNSITTAKPGATVYIAFTHVSTEDVTSITVKDVSGTGITCTLLSKAYVESSKDNTEIYSFVMPCSDATVTGYTAENLNAYNYVWFVGQEWGSWGTTATYKTTNWSATVLGKLQITNIINGKLFDHFDISASLYKHGSVTLTEKRNVTDPAAELALNEYCIIMDEKGLPTLHVKLDGPGTVYVDIVVRDDPYAIYNITQDSDSKSYFTLNTTTAAKDEIVTATLTDAAVALLKADTTGKTTATLTYYGGLLVVLFPSPFTENNGVWTSSFKMPAQDVTTKVFMSQKSEVILTGTDKTVPYDGKPQAIDSNITAKIGTTDVSDALMGQYEVTYTGINGTSYAASTDAPTNVGTYSCAVKFASGNSLYTGAMDGTVTLTIETSTPKAPAAPLAKERTQTSITLSAPTTFADGAVIPEGYAIEYGKAGQQDVVEWQDSLTFTGLNATSAFTFYARIKAGTNSNASDKSAPTIVRTLTAAPDAKEAIIDYKAETISCGDLYEMSKNTSFAAGSELISGASVSNLIGKTVYIRVKATEGDPASDATAVAISPRPDEVAAPIIDYNAETLTVSTTEAYKIGSGDSIPGTGEAVSITGSIPAAGSSAVKIIYYLQATGTSFRSAEVTMNLPARPKTPDKPSAEAVNIKDTGITLNTLGGGEYKQGDGSIWQDDTAFTGLTPNTGYTFYQRIKATDGNFASGSSNASITTAKVDISGRLSISGTPKIGEKLIAAIGGHQDNLGTLSYQWNADDVAIIGATSAEYTLTKDELGKQITVTITALNQNYNPKTSAKTEAVARGDSAITFTEAGFGKGYDGLAMQNPVETTHYSRTGSEGTIRFEWYNGGIKLTAAPVKAGTYSVKAILEEDTYYNATSATKEFEITPKKITLVIEAIEDQTYTGSEIEPDVTVKDSSGTTFTVDTDYTVAYSKNIDAGINTGMAKVTLMGNYSGTETATFTINKVDYTGTKTVSATVSLAGKTDVTVELPILPADAAYGTPTAGGAINMTNMRVNGTTLTYTAPPSTPGQTGTITVPVTGAKNYNDYSVAVTITSINKEKLSITGLIAATGLSYNGTAQRGYTGTVSVSGNKVPVDELVYTYTSTDGGTYNSEKAPTRAGTYKLVLSIAGFNADYTGSHADIVFTIAKAQATVTADSKSMTAGAENPAYTATTEGLADGETITGVTFTDSSADTTKKGSYTIIPAGGTISGGNENYNITYVNGTLTVNIDVSTIDAALDKANTEKTGITVNDNPASSVTSGTKFVTTAEMSALNTAIQTAAAAKATVTTPAEAEAAAQALNDAVTIFNAAIKTGTHTSSNGGGGSSSGGSSGGGSSSGGSSGGSSSGGTGPAAEISGTVSTDGKKGHINSVSGIITGATITGTDTTGTNITENDTAAGTSGDGYSHWKQDKNGWKLQYADNTYAAGTMVTDTARVATEQLTWELINGAWYAFGADDYAKSGIIFDTVLNGWFYIDINSGMKTGWQLIEGTWRYFNPVSDGTKGKMLAGIKTPDGYYVNSDGAWDGQGTGDKRQETSDKK